MGIKLESPACVAKIRFMARNDMNSIQSENKYELFYWNNKTFQSLGSQTARDTMVVFSNVPKGAILWLRNLNGGLEERIFTWKDGKQIWW